MHLHFTKSTTAMLPGGMHNHDDDELRRSVLRAAVAYDTDGGLLGVVFLDQSKPGRCCLVLGLIHDQLLDAHLVNGLTRLRITEAGRREIQQPHRDVAGPGASRRVDG